jgi:hypothetical protein
MYTPHPQFDSTTSENAPNEQVLLEEIVAFLKRYVIVDEYEYVAIALWIIHTHAIEVADTTPYLAALGPEKRCGKTRLLETLMLVVRQPTMTTNVSEAALFRLIQQEQPTLLLDETDTIFGYRAKKENESLRGLINGGYRRGSVVLRCVGDGSNQQVVPFQTFCPKALAGIGDLPDTILDRSLVVAMRRSQPGEKVQRLRMNRPPVEAAALKTRIEDWVREHLEELRSAEPELPDELNDRAQDVCEPLLAISDLLGEWSGARAREALVAMCQAQAGGWEESPGVLLLADIRLAFESPAAEQLSTEELIQRLCLDHEAPWAHWNHQGQISPRALARLLKPYRIKSVSLGDGHHRGRKGYRRGQFVDAWNRYLPHPDSSRDIGDNRDSDESPDPLADEDEDDHMSRVSRLSENGDQANTPSSHCLICSAEYDRGVPAATLLRCPSCAGRSPESGD